MSDLAWNQQGWVRRWARLRMVLVIASSLFSIGAVVALHRFDSREIAAWIHRVSVVSLLAEVATQGATLWLTRPDRRLPFWPLFPFARALSRTTFTHRFWNDALVVTLVTALLGSLALPFGSPPMHATVVVAVAALFILCLADGVRLTSVHQWAMTLPFLAFASGPDVQRIALAGLYFWAGAGKLASRAYYTDTGPEFFAPILRWLRMLGVPRAVQAMGVVAGFAAFGEMTLGALLAVAALMGPAHLGWLLPAALVFNVALHAYIVLFLRLPGLWSWNLACLALTQLAFSQAALREAHGLVLGPPAFACLVFLVSPITLFLGHGNWGRSFTFHFYAYGFDGESWIFVRRDAHRFSSDRFASAFVGSAPIVVTTADECEMDVPYGEALRVARTAEGYEPYDVLLDRLAEDAPRGCAIDLDELARTLGLPVATGESAKETLLRETVAFDGSWIALQHCLERPNVEDAFSSTWESPRPWFWRFFAEEALAAKQAVWVERARWTFRGHRSRVTPI